MKLSTPLGFCSTLTYSHDHPAKHLSKGPVHQCQLQGDERQAHHAQDICHSQVQDVDVSHRLHFGVAKDHIYDQGVAAEPHGANHEVDEGDDHRAGLVLVGLPCLCDVQVQVRLVALDVAVVQEGLGDGDVGGSGEKRPLIQRHDG